MSDELIQRVRTVIASTQRIPVEKITIDSSFEELGIDSMDGVNILFALENEFNITIPDEAAKQIRNVRQMIEGVEKLIAGGASDAAAVTLVTHASRRRHRYRRHLRAGSQRRGVRPRPARRALPASDRFSPPIAPRSDFAMAPRSPATITPLTSTTSAPISWTASRSSR